MGDLNVRIGLKQDCNACQMNLQTSEVYPTNIDNNDSEQISRNSCDIFTNKFGNELIDIVKKADLKILNGRTLGDVTGNYTCTQYNGKSVVDTLFQKCKYFHRF